MKNSTKFLAWPSVRIKSSSNPSGSSSSYRFAVLFIFLALFKGTQKDIPSVKVYYCHKVFQTSNIESEIKGKRKQPPSVLFPFPSLHGLLNEKANTPFDFQSVWEWERERPRWSLNILFFYVSLNGANHLFSKFWIACHQKEFCSIPIPHCL